MQNNTGKYKTKELTFSGDFINLENIRNFIINQANKLGFSNDESEKIALAVDEACTNLIRYSFNFDSKQTIKISVDVEGQFFIVNIKDNGNTFNPLDVPQPNMKEYLKNYKKGGLGIYLIRSIMDEIDYMPSNQNNPQNTLVLKKRLA